jgi:hypothetical protein
MVDGPSPLVQCREIKIRMALVSLPQAPRESCTPSSQLRNIAALPVNTFCFEGRVRTIKKARSGMAIA